MQKFFFLFFLIFILSLQGANALIVSPAKQTSTYTAEGDVIYLTSHVQNDNLENDIIIQVSIPEKQYREYYDFYSIEADRFIIPAGETYSLNYSFTFPETESFGKVRMGTVRFYQVPYGSSGIAATVAIRTPLDVQVPYPEKFLSLRLDKESYFISENEKFDVKATANSKGQLVIDEMNGKFVVEKDGSRLKEISVNKVSLIIPGEERTFMTTINSNGLTTGKYDVYFEAEYDGNKRYSPKSTLIVGGLRIDVEGIDPLVYTSGESTNMKITIFNYWVEDVNVDLDVEIYNEENLVSSKYIGRYTLESCSKEIYTNLDFTDFKIINYTLNVNTKLDNGSVQTFPFEIEVIEKEVEEKNFNLMNNIALISNLALVVLILILIIALVIVFNKNKKKIKKRKKRRR